MNLNYYKNKTILVTGGTGFIGSSLIRRLKKISCKIIALDSKTDIREKNIWHKYLRKIDIIFHLAAQTSSQWANAHPSLDAKINLLPVINLIEVCQDNKFFPDIIFAGTVTEVGLTKTIPVNEAFQDEPITIYDINKLAAEKYLQYYSRQLGGRAVTLRLANVYGPGERSNHKDRGILNSFICKALKGKDLIIYGRGRYIRDYVYIDDVVNAFLTAGANINLLKRNYYLIGNDQGYTLREMAAMISEQVAEKTGRRVKIVLISPPKTVSPIESRDFVANSRRFRNITGWKPMVDLKFGISQTVDYFIKEER